MLLFALSKTIYCWQRSKDKHPVHHMTNQNILLTQTSRGRGGSAKQLCLAYTDEHMDTDHCQLLRGNDSNWENKYFFHLPDWYFVLVLVYRGN